MRTEDGSTTVKPLSSAVFFSASSIQVASSLKTGSRVGHAPQLDLAAGDVHRQPAAGHERPRATALPRMQEAVVVGLELQIVPHGDRRNDDAPLAGEILADAGDPAEQVAAGLGVGEAQQAVADLDREDVDVDQLADIVRRRRPPAPEPRPSPALARRRPCRPSLRRGGRGGRRGRSSAGSADFSVRARKPARPARQKKGMSGMPGMRPKRASMPAAMPRARGIAEELARRSACRGSCSRRPG